MNFQQNKFNIYLLTESRKSEAIDRFLNGVDRERPIIVKTLEAFERFDKEEKPDPRMSNRRFVDKYPSMVLMLLSQQIGYGWPVVEVIMAVSTLLKRIPPLYGSMTKEERNQINDKISDEKQLSSLLDDIEFRVSERGKKEYQEKLKVALEYQKNGEGKILYNDPEKLILMLRGYTYEASCALGYAAWCVASPNTDHHFYNYQKDKASVIYFVHLFSSNIKKALFSKFAIQFENYHDDWDTKFWDKNDDEHSLDEVVDDIEENSGLYNIGRQDLENIVRLADKEADRDPGIHKKFDYEEYNDQFGNYVWNAFHSTGLRYADITELSNFTQSDHEGTSFVSVDEHSDSAAFECNFNFDLPYVFKFWKSLPSKAAQDEFRDRMQADISNDIKEDPIFDSVEKNIVGLAFYENTVEFKIEFGERLFNISEDPEGYDISDLHDEIIKAANVWRNKDKIEALLQRKLLGSEMQTKQHNQMEFGENSFGIKGFRHSLRENKKKRSIRIIIG